MSTAPLSPLLCTSSWAPLCPAVALGLQQLCLCACTCVDIGLRPLVRGCLPSTFGAAAVVAVSLRAQPQKLSRLVPHLQSRLRASP